MSNMLMEMGKKYRYDLVTGPYAGYYITTIKRPRVVFETQVFEQAQKQFELLEAAQ
jgi:hypothetical protein